MTANQHTDDSNPLAGLGLPNEKSQESPAPDSTEPENVAMFVKYVLCFIHGNFEIIYDEYWYAQRKFCTWTLMPEPVSLSPH